MKKLFLALILMATAVTAHAASTNMVVNGSFEATTQGNKSWNNYASLPGWTSGNLVLKCVIMQLVKLQTVIILWNWIPLAIAL